MSCQKAAELIPLYITEEIEEREWLESHLGTCSHCRQLVEKHQRDREKILSLQELRRSSSFWSDFQSELEERLDKVPARRDNILLFKWGTRVALAASLLLALFLWGGPLWEGMTGESSDSSSSTPDITQNDPRENPNRRSVVPASEGPSTITERDLFHFLKPPRQSPSEKDPVYLLPKLPGEGQFKFEMRKGSIKFEFSFETKKKQNQKKEKETREKNNEKTMEF